MLGEQIGRVTVELSTRENGEKTGTDEKGKPVYKFPAVTQKVTFDFTKCSDEQIKELLTSTSPTVRFQSFARSQGTAWLQQNREYVFDVAAECSGRRQPANPHSAGLRAAGKMTKDELTAYIKELEAMKSTR